MFVNSISIFLIFSLVFVFSILSINRFELLDNDKAYGHGLSRDESLPFDISGRQIAIEGILEPPFLNEGNQKPTFIVRTHDEKTNETINDINYRIIAKFKNEIIMDQRFHAIDGVISANLVPSNSSILHTITTTTNHEQKNLSKNDLVEVSLTNPITLKSKLVADGGLYDISVILEKSSKGLRLDSDKKVDLFISIGTTFPFVITETSNDNRTNNNNNDNTGNLTLKVKTFYDEITDFVYDQDNSKITFKMPFTWNLDYVSQIVNLHEELIIPKSYKPLSTVSSFTGKLNGMEILSNTIIIDDYSDHKYRIVHIIIPNLKLKEFTNQIIKNGGNQYAIFEIKPIK
jgi:hypothetical protein